MNIPHSLKQLMTHIYILIFEDETHTNLENAIDYALGELTASDSNDIYTFIKNAVNSNKTTEYFKQIWELSNASLYISGENAHRNFYIYIFDKLENPSNPSSIRF